MHDVRWTERLLCETHSCAAGPDRGAVSATNESLMRVGQHEDAETKYSAAKSIDYCTS